MAVGWHGGSGKRKRVKEREAERTRRWTRQPRVSVGSVHTLGIEVRGRNGGWRGRRAVVDEQEKGRRGWVIYFPPARHNLSRGFSREHAESTAIEEELGRREERGK